LEGSWYLVLVHGVLEKTLPLLTSLSGSSWTITGFWFQVAWMGLMLSGSSWSGLRIWRTLGSICQTQDINSFLSGAAEPSMDTSLGNAQATDKTCKANKYPMQGYNVVPFV
jgi:hypothetical protein